jgi:alkylation response protein AidB-like acyl-CoA dehydrogenase
MNERETDLIAAVRQLARGAFAERAAGYDREGAFPRENVDELKRLGIPGIALSAELGGLGLGAEAQMRIMEEIAYGDASTAVALNMHRIGADLTALLPPFPRRNAVLEDIARHGALMCAPGSIPTAELDNRGTGFRSVEDGANLVISGKAGFASMSEGASYVFLVAAIDRGTNADGAPNEPDFAFTLPRTDAPGVKILYNWDAMGLRATASHDIACEGLEVPRSEALVLPAAMLRAIFQVLQTQTGPSVQQRSLGTLGILAIWLGLAQAAFDFTVEYVAKRHGYLAGTTSVLFATPGYRSEQPWAQTAIGNMEHWLETGRIVFYDTVARLSTAFPNPQEFTRHIVRTVYHLRRMSEEIAMGAMKVCGAHAYVRSRPLERIVRDLLGGVVMAWKTDELVQTLGRGALGMPITIVGPAGS